MNEPLIDVKALDRECGVFCRYLIGKAPNDYVKRKYREANRSRSLLRGNHSSPSDGLLVGIARISPWTTKIIDVYARVFHPFSLVRKKLILLLAILESCAPTFTYLDSVDPSSTPVLFLKSLQRCVAFAFLVVVAILLILPLALAVGAASKFIVIWVPRHG